MGMCWVPDCNHHSTRDPCQFYRMPKYPGIREAWAAAIGRNISPKPDSRVCSCHFVGGDKHSLPCIFKRNADEAHKHLWKTPRIVTRKPTREYSSTTKRESNAQAISTISTPVSLNPLVISYVLRSNVPLTSSNQQISGIDAETTTLQKWHVPQGTNQDDERCNIQIMKSTQQELQQTESSFSVKTEIDTSEPEIIVPNITEPEMIVPDITEPEIIVPDILPCPSINDPLEESSKKFRVATWSRTWLNE